MNNSSDLFASFKPLLFEYMKNLASSASDNIPTFLFYGSNFTGKEWCAIKSIQALNCKNFFLNDHQSLTCKVCSRINLLKSEYGIYSLWSHINPIIIKYYLSLLERQTPLDDLSKESFLHELGKIAQILEAQFIKEQKSSPSKKWGITKLQEYTDLIIDLQNSIIQNIPFNSYNFLYTLLQDIENLSGDISIEYVKYLLVKINTPSVTMPYKALIIKDPVQMNNQNLLMNVLLKTVEESKKNLMIVFISQKKTKILKTIQSRCTGVHFSSISNSYIQQLSEKDPLYPIDLFKKEVPHHLNLEELLAEPNIKPEYIIEYLEQQKALYIGNSELFALKRQEIDHMIIGLKEYRINPKNVQDILKYL